MTPNMQLKTLIRKPQTSLPEFPLTFSDGAWVNRGHQK